MISTDRDTLSCDDDDDHTAIEAIEQQLIQHLRTAGIRKQREVELINQVMILRRERRRSFSAISVSTQKVVNENGNLKAMLSNARKQIELEIKVRNDCISEAVQRKDSEIHCAIQENEKENVKKMDMCSYQMKLQIEKISKRYEEKLQMLDLKIQEMSAARDDQNQRVAESIAFEMTAKAISDLNDRHNAKLQKYVREYLSLEELNFC